MSNSKNAPGGFSPIPVKATFSQFQEMAEFFKKYLEDSPLRKWIVLAGIGGLVEVVHTLWLALRYLAKF